MIQSNEAVTLIPATAVIVFLVFYRRRLRLIPSVGLLLLGFAAMFCGRLATVLEGLFWSGPLNFVEHVCNTGSVLFLAVWLLRMSGRTEGD